jgi:hypothetical protein
LAAIGGYAAMVWSILALVLGDYQAFTFDKSLLKRLYTEDKTHIEEEASDDKELVSRILNRKQFSYSYSELVKAKLMKLCCCCRCCRQTIYYEKKIKRYESYLKVKEKLTGEMDLLKIIQESRITSLLSEICLTLR